MLLPVFSSGEGRGGVSMDHRPVSVQQQQQGLLGGQQDQLLIRKTACSGNSWPGPGEGKQREKADRETGSVAREQWQLDRKILLVGQVCREGYTDCAVKTEKREINH